MNNKRYALITGASNGIGFELAKIIADAGHNLLLIARGKEKLEEAKSNLSGNDVDIITYSADLSKYEDIESLKEWVDAKNIIVDILILNAGQGYGGDFLKTTNLKRELELIRLNIDSYVHLSKLFIKDMVDRNEGKVLMVSSISGTRPLPFEAIYGGTKAFVNSFFYAIRNEIKPANVHMTLLMPGGTETNFFKNADMSNTKLFNMKKADPAEVAQRGWYALKLNHEYVYGTQETEYEGDVLSRIQSESEKAQRHRMIAEPLVP